MNAREILRRIWRFIWPVLVIIASAAVVAAVSFLVLSRSGRFSIRAYSDRLFWAGIALIAFGGVSVMGSLGSLHTLGTPSVLTAGADARNSESRIRDHFRVNAKRYRFVSRWVTSGIVCIAASALLEILTR